MKCIHQIGRRLESPGRQVRQGPIILVYSSMTTLSGNDNTQNRTRPRGRHTGRRTSSGRRGAPVSGQCGPKAFKVLNPRA
jgi:hypothetical protein